jgi:hypothetical protein
MTDYAVTKDWPDTITFDRIHALAQRGYRACLGVKGDDSGFARIDLWHPRTTGPNAPPKLTIWSNGIVATSQLLWPAKHVPQEDGSVPDWQKFIDIADGDIFRNFVDTVPMPTLMDLYVRPGIQHARVFSARFVFGFSLCGMIAAAFLLIGKLAG